MELSNIKFQKIKLYGELVMFSHTIFSLPFAFISMLWAAEGLPSSRIMFWIVVALVSARNGANALNRLVDKDIDGQNPRTANRHLPVGLIKEYEVIWFILGCLGLLILAAYQLNFLCLKLLPLALFVIGIYSYSKRFTWMCHIILGIACGGAPIGAWMAIRGEIGWPSFVLGAVVTFWVAGFDIIYATQDVDFDKSYGLFSIPAKFGIQKSLYISASFHAIMFILLIYLYFLMYMGWFYLIGVAVVGILLLIEHRMVSPNNLKVMKIASYTVNQLVSVIILIFTVIDYIALR